MSNDLLIDVGNLFISFMSAGCGIAVIMYFIIWVVNFLLGLVFPSRYGM